MIEAGRPATADLHSIELATVRAVFTVRCECGYLIPKRQLIGYVNAGVAHFELVCAGCGNRILIRQEVRFELAGSRRGT